LTLASRATLVQGVNVNELLSTYRPGLPELEHADPVGSTYVAVLAEFNHDWQHHLLVKSCHTGPLARLLGMDGWEFSLWFVDHLGPVRVHTFFDAERAPYVEAATMVECWRSHGHYGGVSNALDADPGIPS